MSRRNLTLLVLDAALLCLCYYLSFYLYVETPGLGELRSLFTLTLPLALGAGLAGFYFAGVFSGGPPDSRPAELLGMGRGALYATGLLMAATVFTRSSGDFPLAVFLIYAALMPLAAALSRLSWRAGERIFPSGPPGKRRRRSLVVGAGKLSYGMIEQARLGDSDSFEPVHVVDDNAERYGSTIHGVKIRGGVEDIPIHAWKSRAEEIVVATEADAEGMLRIARFAFRAGLPVRVLPCGSDIDQKSPLYLQLRPLGLVDLIDRGDAEASPGEIRGVISGRKVLVIGADSIIGRSVCRLAVRSNPAQLLLFGSSGEMLDVVDKEVARLRPTVSRGVLIGDAMTPCRMAEVMQEYTPEAVIHIAPHRSAGIVQENFRDALGANAVAVRRAAEEAAATGVSLFIHVSSDEAGEPVNVTGLSMRMGERALQAVSRAGTEMVCASVRVGDALDEEAGLAALWASQARSGGVVTVSHEDTARFYISADRAARLILQSAALAKGGETFSVGPGKRMKTVDVVRLAAVMAGREPGKNFEIIYSGLARGERLVPGGHGNLKFEETGRRGVQVAHPEMPPEDYLAVLTDLEALVKVCDAPREIFSLARELVPEYKPQGRKHV